MTKFQVTSSTVLTLNNPQFDHSDQGSVDSDYTSLASSKFYAHSGSNSSLNRQGRSHSIDEFVTTSIPTRHFNGTSNKNKTTIDPLQFVKVSPNHQLIERAQEQVSLVESRKRLQQIYEREHLDEQTDWNKAVENWRLKREQKRLKSLPTSPTTSSPVTIEINPKVEEPVQKPPPPPPIERQKSKSPSPVRVKGPAKIHEVYIEKPVDVRGFGFKLEGGRGPNRAIFISTIEEGSPADKVGLNVDDELIAINDENIERVSFDQVRKLLKERNLRGTIKLTVKTYEDVTDDQHRTTPIPTNLTPSPVYTFLPYTPPSTTTPPAKPLRTNSNEISESNVITTSPIEAFRQLIDPIRSINTESIYDKELRDLEAEFDKQLKGIDQTKKTETSTTTSDRPTSTQVIINIPPPLSSVETLLHGKTESPMAQVRSYVEKQMDQLQQDLEFGFCRGSKVPAKTVDIPIEIAPMKKSISTQNELDRVPSTRTYGLKIDPNERVIHYLEPYTPQRPLSNYIKRSIPDLSTASTQAQKKVTIQIADRQPSPSNMRKTPFDDRLWIEEDREVPSRRLPRSRSKHIEPPSQRQSRPRSAMGNHNRMPSVSGRLRCSKCHEELGQGSAMVIESLGLYYHLECFRCYVCHIPLSSSFEGTDVRIRHHRLHCPNCFSDDNGVKLSAV